MRSVDLGGWAPLLPLLPFLLVLATSYIKFAVVLAILRHSFVGDGSGPLPASVAGLLALLFALFVTAPVAEATLGGSTGGAAGRAGTLSLARAVEPARAFLRKHTPARERDSFVELQRELRPEAERGAIGPDDFVVLAPAFVTAELKAAFQVGFVLFLPFLVLELLVAVILGALGLTSVGATAVSLPLKLLLFVLVDGWHLLFRGLVLSYT